MAFVSKILLIDDEAHIRKLIGLIARQLGAETILEATNGEDGAALYEKERPDLVLLDVNMPVLDGLGALKKIRAFDPDAVVIMLTSVATRLSIDQCLSEGAANYIRKDTPKETISELLAKTVQECFEDDDSPAA